MSNATNQTNQTNETNEIQLRIGSDEPLITINEAAKLLSPPGAPKIRKAKKLEIKQAQEF